jgi:predicted metal-binding membrane protein
VGRLSVPSALPAARTATIATLGALAALAWAITAIRMEGMDGGPGTDLGTFGFFVTTWVAMMAAMMFPSIYPMVSLYRSMQRVRGGTACFVGGYLVTWTAAGVIAYVLVELVQGTLSWEDGGQWVAVAVLVAAAIYEVTPAKAVCLKHCRSPLAFVMGHWRDGRDGALRMGLIHGAWCLGCCWGLMAALFALGVMSVAWMALIALLIATEKLLPWRLAAQTAVVVTLLALALGIALAPDSVPALTVPGDDGGSMMMMEN